MRVLNKLLLAFFVTSGTAFADNERVEYANLMGPGATTCGEFAKWYAKDPSEHESSYFLWALGFMSGMNAALEPKEQRNLMGVRVDDQKQQIRSYCNEHPLAGYNESVLVLFLSLPMNGARK